MYRVFILLLTFLLAACESSQSQLSSVNLSQAAQYNLQLGLTYLEQNNLPAAQTKLLLAQQQDPQSAEIWAAFAYFLQKSHRAEIAQKYYQKALAIAPNDPQILNNYGAFLCQQGDYDQGLSYLQRVATDISYPNQNLIAENIQICHLLQNSVVVKKPLPTKL